MEATLNLNHHCHPQVFSQSTKPNSINPRLGSGLRHLYHRRPPLHSGSSLQVTRFETAPSRPHFIKSMWEGGGDKEKMEKRVLKRKPSTRSLTLASLRRDKIALDGMLDAKRALHDPMLLENGETAFLNLLEKNNIEWDKLQRVVWKLEMSGNEDKAARLLKERYNKEVNKGDANNLNTYEVGILLAEMMIYQGFYKPARRICTDLLNKRPPTDARPLLYLAVTNVLVGDKMEDAEENWKKFSLLHGRAAGVATDTSNTTQDEPITLTFDQFKSHVYILEDEIALK